MPPQPLSRVKLGAPVLFDPRAMRERPSLAPLVAEAVAAYADIEAQIALVITRFLHAKAEPALAMFEVLTSAAAQIAAARAAAGTALDGEDMRLFEAVLTVTGEVARERHKIVHHQWGFSESLPDALVLADAKVNVRIDMESVRYVRDLAKGIVFPDLPDLAHQDRMFVYRRKDFEEIIAKIGRLKECYWHLSFLHPGGLERGPIRDWLSRQPDIEEALRRRKKGDQKRP